MSLPSQSDRIEYATPVGRQPPRTLAATMVVLSGLALILLGGCFLIGILMTIEHMSLNGNNLPSQPLTAGEIIFIIVLSVVAILCFAGAVMLLILGTRALLRVARS